jgi:hypothetical protein
MATFDYDKIAKNNRGNYEAGYDELKKQNGGNAPSKDQVTGLMAAYGRLAGSKVSSEKDKPDKSVYASKATSFNDTYNISQSNTYQTGEVTMFGDAISSVWKNGFDFMNQLDNIGNEIFKQLQLENQLRTTINEKVGISGELSRGLRQEIVDSYPAAIRFGYGLEQIGEMVSEIMTKSGRFNLISQETLEKSFGSARAFVGSLAEMGTAMTEFEQIGIGAGNAIDEINKAGKRSLELGLVAKGTIKDIRDNIGKINEFGFKNGVQGLAEMSRQSKEFRINMSEAFKIAEKVMDPANAIDMVANLQVIGGAMGDFNDPLKLMYDATNNVEGLQDSLIKAASGLATYNEEQKRFEITGINQRRVRDMAAAMGVDYRELTKSAIASQERMLANNDLMAKGFSIPEKDKEFITNLSKMDNGKMVIEIPKTLQQQFEGQSKIALEDLSQKQIETLEANREQLEKMSPEDIARDQVTSVLNIERDLAAMLELNKIDLSRKINNAEAIKMASDIEKKIGLYSKEYIKGEKGLLSEEFKGNVNAMYEKVKNSQLVSEKLNTLKVLADSLGDKNPKIKKMLEDVESKMKEDIKNSTNSATSTTEGQTKNITFKHEFAPIPAFVDALGSSIVKNPNTFNEWAERNSNEFTTPNVAKK